MNRFIVLVFIFCLGFSQACASELPEKYLVTIQSLKLQNTSGDWVVVADPDREVDLMQNEAVVSFFNQGQVLAGSYKGFSVTLSNSVRISVSLPDAEAEESWVKVEPEWAGQIKDGAVEFHSRESFPFFSVKKGSFIRVAFSFNFGEGVHHVLSRSFNEQSSSPGQTVTVLSPKKISQVKMTVDGQVYTLTGDQIAWS